MSAQRAAEAVCQIRPGTPSGEDPALELSSSLVWGQRSQELRLAWIYTLLGQVTSWRACDQAGTMKSRLRRALRATSQWCRANRHAPIEVQHAALNRKIRGHYAYYGITGNARALVLFRYMVLQIWRKWLRRRSNRARKTWEWWDQFKERYPLLPARVVHSA